MNKSNGQIISEIPDEIIGSEAYSYAEMSFAMSAAREDEREKISQFIEEFAAEYKLPQLTNILDLIKWNHYF